MSAPRLTVQLLKDMEEAVSCLDDTIQYLEEAIPAYAEKSALRQLLTTKYNKLINVRNWIERIRNENT